MATRTILAFATAIALATSPAAADTSFPYATTIHCGEELTTQLTLGAFSLTDCDPGAQAIPAFTSVEAFERYYKVDEAKDCDSECLRPTYTAMKRAGLMHPLISGDHVIVTGRFIDPEDKDYTICRVTAKGLHWLVLCLALTEQPNYPGE